MSTIIFTSGRECSSKDCFICSYWLSCAATEALHRKSSRINIVRITDACQAIWLPVLLFYHLPDSIGILHLQVISSYCIPFQTDGAGFKRSVIVDTVYIIKTTNGIIHGNGQRLCKFNLVLTWQIHYWIYSKDNVIFNSLSDEGPRQPGDLGWEGFILWLYILIGLCKSRVNIRNRSYFWLLNRHDRIIQIYSRDFSTQQFDFIFLDIQR